MAIYNSTTFGSISGRHGSAVATTGKRGNVLKVYKAPFNPNTDKQVAQRTKFGYATTSMACMRELFKYTFRHRGGYNYGLSKAMKNAVKGQSPEFTIDFSKLSISEGSVYGSSVSLTMEAERNLTINWTVSNIGDKGSMAKSDDLVYAVFFNEELREAHLHDSIAYRSDATANIQLPEQWTGKVHGWVYFGRADELLESNSIYLGEVVY